MEEIRVCYKILIHNVPLANTQKHLRFPLPFVCTKCRVLKFYYQNLSLNNKVATRTAFSYFWLAAASWGGQRKFSTLTCCLTRHFLWRTWWTWATLFDEKAEEVVVRKTTRCVNVSVLTSETVRKLGVKRLYRILEYSLGLSETTEYSYLFQRIRNRIFPFAPILQHAFMCVWSWRWGTRPTSRYWGDYSCDIMRSLLASPLSDLMLAT